MDYFKAFNDNYGHLLGDVCLVHIAEIINQVGKRETDLGLDLVEKNLCYWYPRMKGMKPQQ